jgi:hypothetical protein
MLKEYQTQSTLNPKLWIDGKLKPQLHDGFMNIAQHFYEFLEIPADMIDVILIGSSANYNWTKFSDIDIHVVINYLKIGNNLHLVENYLYAKKSIWNTNYPLKYKGMNIELYAQDSNSNLHSTVGVYSIMNRAWIHKPNSTTISIDDDAIQQKAQPYEYEIDSMKEDDPQITLKIKDLLKRLRNLRQSGLEAEGEYSIENLAYKHLRNSGHLSRLKILLQQGIMGQLTIESNVTPKLVKHINKQKLLDESDWHNIISQTSAIEDPMGQWKYPGRCTMIPGNQITMQRVSYPVMGIDDTGHMIMMQPDKSYNFPGTKVFEIPHTAQWQTTIMQIQNQLKNGGWSAK